MRRKILIGIGLFCFVVLLSGYLILRSLWLREKLRLWGIAKLEEVVEGEVEVRKVGGSLISELVLEGVRITAKGEAEPVLRFERGEMGYNLLKLLTTRSIEYIHVHSPALRIYKDDEGWNFQNLFASGGEARGEEGGNPDGGGFPFRVEDISLFKGALDLGGVPAFEGVHEVDISGSLVSDHRGVQVHILGGRGELPGEVQAKGLTGKVKMEKGEIQFEGLHLLTEKSSIRLDGIVSDSLILKLPDLQLSLEELDQYFSLHGLTEGKAEGEVLLRTSREGMRITGQTRISEGRLGDYRVAALSCGIGFQNRVLTLGIGRALLAGGELNGKVVFDFKRRLFTAEGEAESIDLSRLPLDLPEPLVSSLQGTFKVESPDLPWHAPTFKGEVRLRESTLGQVEIDALIARFRTGPGSVQLDSLRVEMGGGALSLKGRLGPQMADLSIRSSALDLSRIGPWVGLSNLRGKLSSDLLFQGRPSQPSLFGTFWVTEGGVGAVEFECLSGNLALDRVGRESLGGADLHFIKGEVLGKVWETADLSFNAHKNGFSYHLQAKGENLNLELQGRGEPGGDSLLVEVDKLLSQLNGEQIENRGRIDLAVKGGELLIRKADLNCPGGSLTMSGVFSPLGESDLTLKGDGLNLRQTSLLFGWKRDLRGEVDFSLNVRGRLTDPRMDLNLQSVNLGYQTGSFDTLNLELSYQGRTLHIDHMTMWREGTKSELMGSLPIDLSLTERGELLPDGRISVDAILNNMGVWVFLPFKEFVQVSSGRVNANLEIAGTWGSPSLTGELTLYSESMLVRFLGTRLSKVTSYVILKDDRLIVDSFSGATEGGQVMVKGVIELDRFKPTFLDFRAQTTGIRVSGIKDVTAIVDADLHIEGTPQAPFFEGTVKVNEALVTIPFRKRRIGPGGLKSKFGLDLTVVGDRNIWLRNDNADLELGADLRVTRMDGRVFVSGVLDTKRGYLYPPHLDVPFEVTKGEFEFTKSVELDPDLDLKAQTEVTRPPQEGSSVIVRLEVTGTMREPDFRFYSDPSYPLEDIITLLSVGTTGQELASLNAVGRGGERLVSHYFRLKVLRQLQKTMAIDAIDVKTELLGEEEKKAELTVGKYVSRDLFLSYTQDLFATSKNQFRAEYYLWRGGAIVAERDEEDKYNLGVQFKFRY